MRPSRIVFIFCEENKKPGLPGFLLQGLRFVRKNEIIKIDLFDIQAWKRMFLKNDMLINP